MRKLLYCAALATLTACSTPMERPNAERSVPYSPAPSAPSAQPPATSAVKPPATTEPSRPTPSPSVSRKNPLTHIHLERHIQSAEVKASPSGRNVLSAGRIMTLKGKIIRGGCWDYANAIYNQAGYPDQKRKTVFKGGKANGPYASPDMVKPGDWLYYVNTDYGNIEHSAIFVDWVGKKQGMMISYAGERRREPAQYSTYNLSKVYQIIRPVDR